MTRLALWALGMVGAALPGVVPAAGSASIQLHECTLQHPLRLGSVDARCATLRVPEDPDAPTGAGIDLHVAVIAALNRRAQASPLFILAGGPGQGATDMYVSQAAAFARINRNHDLVLLDQRGTGASNPQQCRYPDDWSPASASMPQIRAATEDCLRRLGPQVRFYTTALAVQDLERVRRALGYRNIDLYGASYGTRVAQSYMRRFPQYLDAVILDGVTDPQRPIGPDTPADAQRGLDAIVARCRANADCAKAFPDLKAELAELAARFGTEESPVKFYDPVSAAPLALSFNRTIFAAALRFLSYSSSQAALLPELIHRAASGDLAALASQALLTSHGIGEQIAIGMQNTVVCSEDFPFFDTGAEVRARAARTYFGTDQLDGLKEICSRWPRGPVDRELHSALRAATPTLLLSGQSDPVTPPAAAESAARFLMHHRHLILAGEGHGQLATGCVPRLMAQFLDRPVPEQLDAGCLDRHRPAAFFVGANGPVP